MNISTLPLAARWTRAVVATAAALVVIAGCNEAPAVDYATEGDVWKSRIAEAMERTESASAHRFEGSLVFRVNGAGPLGELPLLPGIGDGFSWSGAVYREPLRLEADMRFPVRAEDASGQPDAQTMPLLIQDNKLYVSVPMLNEPDEYLSVDLASDTASGPVPLAALHAAADAIDELATSLVSAVDPEWVRLAEPQRGAAVETGEAADAAVGPFDIAVIVTEDNAERLEAAFREGWSAWTASFASSLGGSAALVPDGVDFDLAPGGTILVSIDDAGFVASQSVDLAFLQAADGEGDAPVEIGHLAYRAARSEIGGTPSMTKEVPASTLPFDHVLRFLAAGRQQP